MRRQTELRTVSRKEQGSTVDVKRSTGSDTHETKSLTTRNNTGGRSETTILAPMREMERWIEESFNRPFLGLNWNPFRTILHDVGVSGELIPAVDMFEEEGNLIVKAELPGITREGLNLRIVDNALIITGERKTEENIERSNYLRLERSHGSFSRTLNLPDGLDTEHIKATFKDGVLEVRIPRTASSSTVRQITVE
ncbi:MAG: Hsp20/alpha crystallin family protein [Desulfuromonadales bacterium]|nr:MAG: Hsp20/alpha crystallin family protein [Desulfuromonadales bacterium]